MWLEALGADGALHLVLRFAIGERIVVDILHRPADDDGSSALAGIGLGAGFSSPTKAADDFEEGQDAALDADGFVGQRRAEDAT